MRLFLVIFQHCDLSAQVRILARLFLKKDLKLILLIPTHFEASTQTSDIRMKKRSTALCGTNEIILMRNSVDHQFHIPYPTKFELHLSLSFKVAQKNMTNGEAF